MKAKLHSIDDFLKSLHGLPGFHLSKGQAMGFKSLIKSKHLTYVFNTHKYLSLLKKYLNK